MRTQDNQEDNVVYAPLFDFNCYDFELQSHGVQFSDGVSLVDDCATCKRLINSEGPLKSLSKYERDEVRAWQIRFKPLKNIKNGEVVNAFLTALWLARSSRTSVHYYFVEDGGSIEGIPMFDRFIFIRPIPPFSERDREAIKPFSESDIEAAKPFFERIMGVLRKRGRLSNSLALTVNGLRAFYWQVSVVSFSCAAEGLLFYKGGKGVTERCAIAFACLTEESKDKRDAAYKRFDKMYNIRCDIVHGVIAPSRNRASNVKDWMEWRDLIRRLWRSVLKDDATIKMLESGKESERQKFFVKIQEGYKRPKNH